MKFSSPNRLRGVSLQVSKWLTIAIISIVFAIIIYPSAFIYSQDTLPDNNDTRLIAYIIGQVQQNVLEGRSLHYGTFFAPEQNTLAYSELFLTTSLITLPFRIFVDSPIVIFNIAFVLGFVLTTLSAFLLSDYLFKNIWISTLTTLLFIFSGFHLHYYPHLQMFSLWPFLLSIYFFLRFLKENKNIFIYLFFLSLTAQIAESVFPAYLIFFTSLILFFSSPTRSILVGRKIIIRALPFLLIWFLLMFPYLQLHLTFPEATRPIRDAAHFSLGLEEIFTKYQSWTVIVLFAIASLLPKVWQSIKINTDFPGSPRRILLAMTKVFIFSLVMSLGPVLKIFDQSIKILGLPIPLPYTIFYYLFPGFNGFRTPSRFIILALLAGVIIIGYHLKPIFIKLKSKTKFLFILLILAFIFAEADLPLKGYPVNINMHSVYGKVAKLPKDAIILELPIKLWNMPEHEIESIRSLYSLKHQHRRFGGFSGFATNSWIDLVEKINTYGLNQENTEKLKTLGITHVIENNTLRKL